MFRDEEMGIKFFLWNTMKSLELVVDSIFMESDIIGTIHQWIYLLSEYSNTIFFFIVNKFQINLEKVDKTW